jgi:hypothetical protein
LKQNLKIKTFVETNANAGKDSNLDIIDCHADPTVPSTSISIPLVPFESGGPASRMNLFTHRDLWAWLNKPFDVLPIPYGSEQLKLQFA